MQRIFYGLKGSCTSLIHQTDLALRFHQTLISETGQPNPTLHVLDHAGLGLMVLHAAFTRVVKEALAPTLHGVESWLDDILIDSTT